MAHTVKTDKATVFFRPSTRLWVKTGENIVEQQTPEIKSVGTKEGCFIATAVYGARDTEKLDTLRKFRDEKLLTNNFGAKLVDVYYKYSPEMADYIAQHPALKYLVKETQIDPLVWVIEKLNN